MSAPLVVALNLKFKGQVLSPNNTVAIPFFPFKYSLEKDVGINRIQSSFKHKKKYQDFG